jgi:methylated-DNA-[protein]-cysteine S-methyltransferase
MIATAPVALARYHGGMEIRYCATVESPAGPLHVVVDDAGRVTGVWFGVNGGPEVVEESLRGHGQTPVWDDGRSALVTTQIREYAKGTRRAFDLELAPQGAPWERQVWAALREIPYGETRSYGQIATALGDAGKARAVGWANAANPIPVIIPCHRVIGAGGKLVGFGGGIETKVRLLAHEGALLL